MAPGQSKESSNAAIRELLLRLASSQASSFQQPETDARLALIDFDSRYEHDCRALVALEAIEHLVPTARDEEDLIEAVQGVEFLNLADSSIGDDGLIVLIRAFEEGSGRGRALRKLDLRNNGITSRGFRKLADSLERKYFPGLQDLIVSMNNLGPEGVDMLSRVLRTGQLPSLRGLDLGFCNMDGMGMASFADALQSGRFASWGLQSLDVSGNGFGVNGAVSLMDSLGQERLPQLTFLNLSNNELGKDGTQALAAVLRSGSLPRLQYLLLSCCGLSDGFALVAGALEAVLGLLVLDLSGNHVGERGSVALARAFRTGKMRRLRQLSLSQCAIGPQQVTCIVEGIFVGQVLGLGYLDLSRNPLGSDSSPKYNPRAKATSQCLAPVAGFIQRGCLSNLEFLDISYTMINDFGLIPLARCMAAGKLPKLQTFLFEGNGISSKGAIKAVLQAVDSGNLAVLQDLELGRNSHGKASSTMSHPAEARPAAGLGVEKLKRDLEVPVHPRKGSASYGLRTRDQNSHVRDHSTVARSAERPGVEKVRRDLQVPLNPRMGSASYVGRTRDQNSHGKGSSTEAHSAEAPGVEKLKRGLEENLRKESAGYGARTRDQVRRFIKRRSFRRPEPGKEAGKKERCDGDRLRNKYLQGQSSNYLTPVVIEAGPAYRLEVAAKAFFNLVFLGIWLLAIIISKIN